MNNFESEDFRRAISNAFGDWLDEHSNLVFDAIAYAVAEYIRNYGLPEITIKDPDE